MILAELAMAALATTFLSVAALFQIVDAAQTIATGCLRRLKDTRIPMLMAVVSYWGVGFATAYVLGFELGHGGAGVWLGLAAGLVVACALLVPRFLMGRRYRDHMVC